MPGDTHDPQHPLHVGHTHRDVRGGAARAAVFGVSDGLVSNVGLILGVAGADPAPSVVRVAGLAGLIAGAISMAAGEYNSMRAIQHNPKGESAELRHIYRTRGVDPDAADALVASVMADEDLAVRTHVHEELGFDPDDLGSPLGAAGSSFVAFAIGAVVPLAPWWFGGGNGAIVASVVAALVAAVVIGAAVARFTDRPTGRAVLRQVLFTAVPAALTYAIGSAVGVSV